MFNKPRKQVFLAPLAGINDPAFRLMCEEQGANATFTELTSIDFLYSEKQEALKKILRAKKEKKVGLQLFGKNPEKIKEAMNYTENFDFIDFNAGCPANNIIGQEAGADLLSKPVLLKKMLQEIINNTNKPVTLKYRLGINKNNETYLKIGKMAEDLGVSMITLHARYADQGYSGIANWEKIKNLKEKINIPVTGNGDINKAEKAKDMFKETSCDHVMIGRWAMGNPWCFNQVKSYLEKNSYSTITETKKLKGFLKYVKEAKKYEVPLPRIRIQAMQFTKGIKKGAELRKNIATSKEEEQIINTITDFLIK
ncbi:tRNA-dihydrouridine synthase [Candidatus Woesearchaeota archaeon]|nr:tRNA-dihydrouridine synthase [Candidatus Woesearchaeota archaeon]